MGRAVFDYGDLGVAVRGWRQFPEDNDNDDNPNTEDYYGYDREVNRVGIGIALNDWLQAPK